MGRNPSCTVFIEGKFLMILLATYSKYQGVSSCGNLDEKVTDRILYEILIQVGRVVDLHIPRDKETNRQKGYAFAEYESEEIAEYAVRLFSGLVRLHNKTLRFAMSGQDKPSQSIGTPLTPKPNSPPLTRTHSQHIGEMEMLRDSPQLVNCRVSSYSHSVSPSSRQASAHGFVNNEVRSSNFDYSRRVFGSFLGRNNRSDSRHPIAYPQN